MSEIYPIDGVRRFLEERGARRLAAQSPELPRALKGKPQSEDWLVPTTWVRVQSVIVHFEEAYPDNPPSLYLPAKTVPWPLIPHVNEAGSICTIGDDATVHPEKPVEVLEQMLVQAGGLLDREYSQEEKLAEIEPEMAAYWSLGHEETVYFFAEGIVENFLKVQKEDGRNDAYRLAPIVGKVELAKFDGLGIALDVPRQDILCLLEDPARLLLTSEVIRTQLLHAGSYIANHNRAAKSLPIFFVFRLPTGMKGGVLVGRLRDAIRIKKSSGSVIVDNIFAALKRNGVRRLSSQDLSSRRLLFRTAGPDFSDLILDKKVALIGCGSLGGFLADILSRSGVRRMLFCDQERLEAANLGRHVGGRKKIHRPKAEILAEQLIERLPDSEAVAAVGDFRTAAVLECLHGFEPDFTIFATGDTNSDLTGARLAEKGGLGTCCFVWAEPDLVGGHLVCQPPGVRPFLIGLHQDDGQYKYRIVRNPLDKRLTEAGCQTAFTPYSGADMMQFCCYVARQILAWLSEPPPLELAMRWHRESPSEWERMAIES